MSDEADTARTHVPAPTGRPGASCEPHLREAACKYVIWTRAQAHATGNGIHEISGAGDGSG